LKRALLDVNVLIALLDTDHLHHDTARNWLARNIDSGWASCPLTQNGCIRILSQPAYPGSWSPAAVAERLAEATVTPWHAFWPDSISLLDERMLDWNTVLTSRQVTDVYLLALAVRRRGRFVTFDRSVMVQSVTGAKSDHLVVL
jgi:toxin-antitoxin system PIN domain toxin